MGFLFVGWLVDLDMCKYLPLLLLIGFLFGQKQYDIKHIVKQGGVYKKKFSDEVVNGEVFQMFGDMKVPLGTMEEGKKEGVWMDWNENGTKKNANKLCKRQNVRCKNCFQQKWS